MRAGPYRNVNFFALLATFSLIAVPPVHATDVWSITQFEVFAGAPYQRANGDVEDIGFDWAEAEDWFPDFDRAQVEKALHEAAEWYSKEGFPEPVLEPMTPNGEAYRVYVCTPAGGGSLWVNALREEFLSLFGSQEVPPPHWSNCGRDEQAVVADFIDEAYGLDLPKNSWAQYSGVCAVAKGFRPVIVINAEGPAFKDGKLTAEGHVTLAHELFHAIQANTVQGNSPHPCKISKWISEGQADAVSMDMFDEIWPELPRPSNDGWINKYWGIRPYYENIALDPSGYLVSSFWAFLADLNRGYDFLLTSDDGAFGVFDFEIQEAGKWQSEVMWLDEGLSAQFDMRLNELLGLFMNDFSMRVPTMSWTSGDLKKDWPRWVNSILFECQEISISPRKPSQLFVWTLEPLAGACIWLTVSVPPYTATAVSLQAESADVSVFKDVLVGLPRGNAILTPAREAGTSWVDLNINVGIWPEFTVPAGYPVLLTLTNAADDPQNSKKRRDVLFQISLSESSNNLRGNAPAGPGELAPPALRPTYEKNKQSLSQKTAATTAMISEQKRLDKGVLTPFAALSTGVTFHPERPACRNPFKYSPCGPHMRISMGLMPGTWLSMGQSAGTGGPTSQIASSLIGQSLASPFDHVEVMAELDQKLESIDASSISITMPYVDYGFTGSFNNTLIRTKVGGISMESIGPRDENKQFPLIGTVNIEAYTQFYIQGSFSAPLAYFEPGLTSSQKVYRSGPTLTGTFNLVAPWLSDSRFTRIELQTEQEKDDDIGSVLDQLTNSILSSLEQGDSPGDDGSAGDSASSGNSSAGTVGGGCDCDCANRGELDESCENFCVEAFAVCPE